MPLKASRQRFAAEYVIDCNATQAAIRCGYSPKTAHVQGLRLLRDAGISKLVAELQSNALNNAGVTAERVIRELGRLAFQDHRNYWTKDGKLRPIHELSDDEAAAVASVEVVIKNAEAGDGVQDVVHKLKTWDKPKSLEMLAKHFALLTDVVRVTGDKELLERLQSGRKRAGK